MKKSLIALAALAATGAFAQSSVTIGGVIDQAYYSVKQNSRDASKSTKQTGFGEGSWAGSRIRFSGSEDLGGGLRANFWLEQGIAPSDGNGFDYRNGGNAPQFLNGSGMTFQNRQSYVGLSGGFGEVRLGRLYAAGYDMWTNSGHINGEMTGTLQAVLGLASRTKGLSYESPNINGFRFYGTVGGRDTETTNTVSTDNQVTGYQDRKEQFTTARVMWNSGPARAGATLERLTQRFDANNAAVTNYFGGSVAAASVNAAVAGKDIDSKLTAVQAGYNFGVADVGVLWGNKIVDNTITNVGKADTKLSQVNVKVPVPGTAFEVRYSYTTQDTKTAGVATSDIKGQFANVNYALSKRTRTYASYGIQKDSLTAAATNGAEEKRFAVGLMHSF